MAKKPKKLPSRKLMLLSTAGLIIIIALVFFAVHKTKKTVSTIPSTSPSSSSVSEKKSAGTTSSGNSGGNSALTDSSKPAATPYSGTSANLVTPFGTFISNHHPTATGSPGPNEESVCNTTPGASCAIQFTKGNVTKQLAAQTVDSSGSAYWKWNINDAGLTVGSWDVTVSASLNGKTLTAKDTLDVQ